MTDPFVADATCRVARATMVVSILGLTLDAAFWETAMGSMPRGHLICIAFVAALWVVLIVTRGLPSEALGTVALLACVTAVLAALEMSDRRLAGSTVMWSPFEAQKLGTLTLALLAPPRAWLGTVCIAEVTVVPLVEWASWSPAWRARFPVAAAWMVVAYGLFALVVYAHQLSRRTLERRVAVARAEAASSERFARLAILVRDLANTPLQTIELTVAALRRRLTFDPALLDRLERAAARLVAIGRALESSEPLPADGRAVTDTRRRAPHA